MRPSNNHHLVLFGLLAGTSIAAPLGVGENNGAVNKARQMPTSNIYTITNIFTTTEGSIPGFTPILSTDIITTTEANEIFPTTEQEEEEEVTSDPTNSEAQPTTETLSLSTKSSNPDPPPTSQTTDGSVSSSSSSSSSSSASSSSTSRSAPSDLPITFSVGPRIAREMHIREPQTTSAASETTCTSGCIVLITNIEGPTQITISEGGPTMLPTDFEPIPTSDFVTLSLSIVEPDPVETGTDEEEGEDGEDGEEGNTP